MKTMNKKSKIFSVFLIAVLLCFAVVKVNAITTNSTAGTIDTNSAYVTDKATLTVTGVQSEDQFKAYKLLDAFYNSTANTVTYEFTTNFKAYLDGSETNSGLTVDSYFDLTSGSITSGSTQTTSTLDTLVSGYVSYIKTHSVSGTDMTVSGNTASATLEAGAYLVIPVSTTKIYAPMVGNLDFEAAGTTWTLNNEAIVAKVTDANGIGRLAGVTAGTYYLKETKAPVGYRMLDDALQVKVKVEGSTAASTEGYYKAEISNTKNGILPFTGGNGLLIYSIFGIIVIGIAGYLIIEKQKKDKMSVQEQ